MTAGIPEENWKRKCWIGQITGGCSYLQTIENQLMHITPKSMSSQLSCCPTGTSHLQKTYIWN